MHKTTLYLPNADVRLLKRRAAEEGRTMTALIREALQRFLRAKEPPNHLEAFLKLGGSMKKNNPFGDPLEYQRKLRAEWKHRG